MKLYFLNSGRVEMKKKIFIPDLKTDKNFNFLLFPLTLITKKQIFFLIQVVTLQ